LLRECRRAQQHE
jgi:hypothetical protein